MKKQIDELVQSILRHLDRVRTTNPLLAAALEKVGVDGLSVAIEQRALLDSWTIDETLPSDDRVYARQQLDSLPSF